MAKKVTRIKASDGPGPEVKAKKAKTPSKNAAQPIELDDEVETVVKQKLAATDKKDEKKKAKALRKAEKAEKRATKEKENANKKHFILFRPFIALGHYFRNSWREIRQVRWPSRKDTWKMLLAVLVYTALFVLIISLLDLFFTWLFGLILG